MQRAPIFVDVNTIKLVGTMKKSSSEGRSSFHSILQLVFDSVKPQTPKGRLKYSLLLPSPNPTAPDSKVL